MWSRCHIIHEMKKDERQTALTPGNDAPHQTDIWKPFWKHILVTKLGTLKFCPQFQLFFFFCDWKYICSLQRTLFTKGYLKSCPRCYLRLCCNLHLTAFIKQLCEIVQYMARKNKPFGTQLPMQGADLFSVTEKKMRRSLWIEAFLKSSLVEEHFSWITLFAIHALMSTVHLCN